MDRTTNSALPLGRLGRGAALACAVLHRVGWRIEGTLPNDPKLVAIVYPHTSNWDLPLGLLTGIATGAFARWRYGFMMKKSVFWGPFGPFMRWLGGIPIDRSATNDIVTQMTQFFAGQHEFMLVVTPEGTRKKTTYWKSGFYHIAQAVNVPVFPVYFDYKRRIIGLCPPYTLTGDTERDLAHFRTLFAGVTPKYPGNAGDIAFKPRSQS
jgi:1-acyl-sn-glycerol-3-phosphate acyltransferase